MAKGNTWPSKNKDATDVCLFNISILLRCCKIIQKQLYCINKTNKQINIIWCGGFFYLCQFYRCPFIFFRRRQLRREQIRDMYYLTLIYRRQANSISAIKYLNLIHEQLRMINTKEDLVAEWGTIHICWFGVDMRMRHQR